VSVRPPTMSIAKKAGIRGRRLPGGGSMVHPNWEKRESVLSLREKMSRRLYRAREFSGGKGKGGDLSFVWKKETIRQYAEKGQIPSRPVRREEKSRRLFIYWSATCYGRGGGREAPSNSQGKSEGKRVKLKHPPPQRAS